jgi:hypothetical protein
VINSPPFANISDTDFIIDMSKSTQNLQIKFDVTDPNGDWFTFHPLSTFSFLNVTFKDGKLLFDLSKARDHNVGSYAYSFQLNDTYNGVRIQKFNFTISVLRNETQFEEMILDLWKVEKIEDIYNRVKVAPAVVEV